MGYHISPNSVNRNRPQLEAMFEAQATVRFSTGNPQKLAGKLREAMAAAEKLEYTGLSSLRRDFIIKALDREVVAEFQGAQGIEPEKPAEREVVLEASSMTDLMMSAMALEDREEISFPSVVLSEEEKQTLFEWIKGLEWKFIDHGGGGVTLTKKDVPEEVLWESSMMKPAI